MTKVIENSLKVIPFLSATQCVRELYVDDRYKLCKKADPTWNPKGHLDLIQGG